MVTADTFFLAVNVNDKRRGVRVCFDDHEGSNGFALQLVFPVVVGRVQGLRNNDSDKAPSCKQWLPARSNILCSSVFPRRV